MDLLIKNARRVGADGGLVNIGVKDGRIASISPAANADEPPALPSAQVLDAAGNIVTPTFVDPHTHIDKALTADRCPPNRSGLIDEVIANTLAVAATLTDEDVYERACEVLQWFVQNGVTIIRTHVDIGPACGLHGLRGVLAAKRRYADLIDLQVVAFAQWGILRSPGTEELLEQALKEGADLVGANTAAERSNDDIKEQMDIIFRLAREYDADVDVHADSTDDPQQWGLHFLALKTIETGWHGRVTAGHCDALAAYDPYFAGRVISAVREAGISIVTMPIKMLYAGVHDQHPKRRGMTRIEDLLAAGVNVCTAQDNILDGFQPVFGQCDPLETAMLVAYNYGWKRPEDTPLLYDMITHNAAKALQVEQYGITVGAPAHLNVLAADRWTEALRTQADRRWVIRNGRVVAETETVRRWHPCL